MLQKEEESQKRKKTGKFYDKNDSLEKKKMKT